jgi:hypothetical protein
MPWLKLLDDFTGASATSSRVRTKGRSTFTFMVEGTIGGSTITPKAIVENVEGVEKTLALAYLNRSNVGTLILDTASQGTITYRDLAGVDWIEFDVAGGSAVNLNIYVWSPV